MTSSNEGLKDLYRHLSQTTGAYEALYQRVQDTELGDAISTILSRRKENIAELENFLSSEGEEVPNSCGHELPAVSTPAEVVATERRTLDAYDTAISATTAEHEKYRFLVDQYEWLDGVVKILEPNIAL